MAQGLTYHRYLWLLLALIPLQASSQDGEVIEILHSDYLEYDKNLGTGVVKYVGKVAFRHEEVLMYCDSAYLYTNENKVQAFDNIHIIQGDTLHLYYDSKIQSQTPDTAELIADEGDYSIWNKPYGMYSQGSKWGDQCSIYRWAETHLEPARPAYLVHRLDRAASGLIILAHNKKTATAFAQMFKQHRITKKYRVTVEGDIGELELPFIIDTPLDGKAARTTILESTFNKNQRTSTVLVEITTGRKHQIRRHLSSLGYPVVGDRLYHATNTSLDLQLSSVYLGFDCPRDHIKRTYALS